MHIGVHLNPIDSVDTTANMQTADQKEKEKEAKHENKHGTRSICIDRAKFPFCSLGIVGVHSQLRKSALIFWHHSRTSL